MTAIMVEPDAQQKLDILSDEAGDEVASVPTASSIQQGVQLATGFIYKAQREGGGKMSLLKVLQTNACRYAWRYSVMSISHCFTSSRAVHRSAR